jgi:hypothetical protein
LTGNVELFREKFRLLSARYPGYAQHCDESLITPGNRNIFNSAALEDHHALIPLAPLSRNASAPEQHIFDLVLRSFFTVCMPDYVYNKKLLEFHIREYAFRSVINEVIQQGFKAALKEEPEKDKEEQEAGQFDEQSCVIQNLAIRDCVKAANNIDTLTGKAYRFLNLSSGFIAHYDRFGFMEHYREPGSLRQDILDYQNENQWGNFRSGERGYEFYMQKKNLYNAVCDCFRNNIEYRPVRLYRGSGKGKAAEDYDKAVYDIDGDSGKNIGRQYGRAAPEEPHFEGVFRAVVELGFRQNLVKNKIKNPSEETHRYAGGNVQEQENREGADERGLCFRQIRGRIGALPAEPPGPRFHEPYQKHFRDAAQDKETGTAVPEKNGDCGENSHGYPRHRARRESNGAGKNRVEEQRQFKDKHA